MRYASNEKTTVYCGALEPTVQAQSIISLDIFYHKMTKSTQSVQNLTTIGKTQHAYSTVMQQLKKGMSSKEILHIVSNYNNVQDFVHMLD